MGVNIKAKSVHVHISGVAHYQCHQRTKVCTQLPSTPGMGTVEPNLVVRLIGIKQQSN